jgi:hypothetical protein
MNKTIRFTLSLAFMVASISFAEGTPKSNPFKQVLASVPAAEMPAKAAELIARAKTRDRATTTLDVITAAIAINPAATPTIVAAAARSMPYMASAVAGIAAAEQPKQAAAIAKAAAAAAPSQARKIVMAVCRAVPNDYRSIALAVSEAVPTASKEILNAIASAFPQLKPYIEQALIAHGGNASVLSSVLDDAVKLAQVSPAAGRAATTLNRPLASASTTISQPTPPGTLSVATAPLARGPAVGPPFIPLSNTPTNATPGGSGTVPAGGRNYSEP